MDREPTSKFAQHFKLKNRNPDACPICTDEGKYVPRVGLVACSCLIAPKFNQCNPGLETKH